MKSRLFAAISVLVILSLACQLPGGSVGPTSQPTAPARNQNPSLTRPAEQVTPIVPDLRVIQPVGLPAGTPQEVSRALVRALAEKPGQTGLWLGLYQALGIPVFGPDGQSLTQTGDDPVGPPYWVVWLAAGFDRPDRGVTLTDAAKILTVKSDGTYAENPGPILLGDIQSMPHSSDAQVQLLGEFTRQRIMANSQGKDPLDAAADPDALYIDATTLQLLHWTLNRGLLASLVDMSGSSTSVSPVAYRTSLDHAPLQAKPNCSEMFGSEDATTSVNWILNHYLTGLSMPLVGKDPVSGELRSLGLTGLNETILKSIGATKQEIERLGTAVAYVNAVGTVLSAILEYHSLTIDVDQPGPLVRTKSPNENGAEQVLTWHLYYDKDKTPDGNDLWNCMSSFMLNTQGISFSFPPVGDIAGAEVEFDAGHNIPGKVMFNSANTNAKIETGSDGRAELKVIGRAQPRKLPENAHAYNDTFSLQVYAQPEAETGSSLINMFLDSFVAFSAPSIPTALAPLIDLLKTLHYNLGEFEFGLTDWQMPAYQVIDTSAGRRTYKGDCIPDLDKAFTISFTEPEGEGAWQFSPDGTDAGAVTYDYTLQFGGSSMAYTGEGRYHIEVTAYNPDNSPKELDIVYTTTGSVTACSMEICTTNQTSADGHIPIRPSEQGCPAK